MLKWVADAWDEITSEMVQKAFTVCGFDAYRRPNKLLEHCMQEWKPSAEEIQMMDSLAEELSCLNLSDTAIFESPFVINQSGESDKSDK